MSNQGDSSWENELEPVSDQIPLPNVCIAGGGIGGVALALSLEQRGIPYTLFESDESFESRAQGYGLTLQQGGVAIKKLGLKEKVSSVSGWSSRHFIFDKDGNVVLFWGPTWNSAAAAVEEETTARGNEDSVVPDSDSQVELPLTTSGTKDDRELGEKSSTSNAVPLADPQSSWKGKHNLHIPRQVLRRVMYDSIQDRSRFTWNSRVIGAKMNGEKVVVEWQDNSSGVVKQDAFDCLVGCDGIHSATRELFMGDEKTYLGVFVMLGIVEATEFPLCHERVFQTSNGSTRLFVMPFDNSTRSMWQLSFPMNLQEANDLATAGKTAQLQVAQDLCHDWHDPIPRMLAGTEAELVTGYPVFDREPTHQVVSKDEQDLPITLLGDALHCMSPFKGQGANQALLDAIDIAERIEMYCEPVQKSWRRWQKLRSKEKRRLRRAVFRQARDGQDGDSQSKSKKCSVELTGELGAQGPLRPKNLGRMFRRYERDTIVRTTPKVLGSRSAVQVLHNSSIVETEAQANRREFKTEVRDRVAMLRNAGIDATKYQVLDQLAFTKNSEEVAKLIGDLFGEKKIW